MSYSFIDSVWDNESKPYNPGTSEVPQGPRPQMHNPIPMPNNMGGIGASMGMMSPGGPGGPGGPNGQMYMAHGVGPGSDIIRPDMDTAAAYGSGRQNAGPVMGPGMSHERMANSRQYVQQVVGQPQSSGAPLIPEQPNYQQQMETERRNQERVYAMNRIVHKQQDSNDMVMKTMKQYCSSIEILLFIVIAFCVVMTIVQIVVCRKVMTLSKSIGSQ